MNWLVPVLLGTSAEDYRKLATFAVNVLVFLATVLQGVWSRWKGRSRVVHPQPTAVYIIVMAAPVIVVVGHHSAGRG